MMYRYQPFLFQPVPSLLGFSVSELLEEVRAVHFPDLDASLEARFAADGSLAYIQPDFMGRDRHLVVFHPVLNHPQTPVEVMRFICKHELTHLACPPRMYDGWYETHPPEFWDAEETIGPERHAVWHWTHRNLNRCTRDTELGYRVFRGWKDLRDKPRTPYMPELPFNGEDWSRICPDEGRGVVAVIAPWNFPLAILTGMASGALAAGCAVVLKPAEEAPIIASELVQALEDAGIPPGVVNFLPGRGEEAGVALVEHPDVAMVAFTGGGEAGLDIMRRASEVRPGQMGTKHVIAELGGKNAIIVDEDADLDEAVSGVIASAFAFAGQKCSACSRVIVVGSARDEFRARLAAAVESLAVGDPADPLTVVPPVISAAAKARVEAYIEIGSREGRLLAKGALPDSDGHYVAPHVFEEVPRSSRLVQEEVFGPVLTLSSVPTFDAAIAEALDSKFGLTGGVYSRNPRNIEEARQRFRVGNLYINRAVTGAMVRRQPFAGLNMSGTGHKTGGPDYVREFTVGRVVTENTMRRGFVAD